MSKEKQIDTPTNTPTELINTPTQQIEERQRLTTDNPHTNVHVMLNYAYAKDGRVFLRYGNGEEDIDLCDYVSREAADYHCKPSPEEVMEGACMECDCPLAILYVVATQAAELRERLKEFEDREENKGEQSEGEWLAYPDDAWTMPIPVSPIYMEKKDSSRKAVRGDGI